MIWLLKNELFALVVAQPSPSPHPGMPAWFNCTDSAAVLAVTFGKPVGGIDCGTRIEKCPESPTQTEPTLKFTGADGEAGYVVMMIDGSNAYCRAGWWGVMQEGMQAGGF